MQCFLTLSDSGSGTVISIKYPSTVHIIFVHIFSQEYENFPFFLELSRPVHRGYFRPKEWHFRVTGSISLVLYSWTKMCDRVIPSAPFNADSPETLPSAQKLFLPTVEHVLLIQFLHHLGGRQNRSSSYSIYFGLLDLHVFGCFRDILSSCQAVSAIFPFWHTASVLDIIVLSWCRIWSYSIL